MQSPPLIFVVEDDEDIAALSTFHLNNQGYRVESFSDGEAALQALKQQKPNLILLDLMLPKIDGLKLCEIIKSNEVTKDINIIMVTAKGEEADIVRGLELGADDYITKPFSTQVLIARTKSILRRQKVAVTPQEKTLNLPNITINPSRREVSVGGQLVDLTNSEFQLLQFLAQKPGWVFTRSQIVDAIRGTNYAVTERSIDVVIVGLRKKLGESGSLVDTVRGVGYRVKEFE